MQVVQLDKHIRLLDSPGVVIATKMADSAAAVLRNCVRVSNTSVGRRKPWPLSLFCHDNIVPDTCPILGQLAWRHRAG